MADVPHLKRRRILIVTAAAVAIIFVIVAIVVANSVSRSQKLAQYIGITAEYVANSLAVWEAARYLLTQSV